FTSVVSLIQLEQMFPELVSGVPFRIVLCRLDPECHDLPSAFAGWWAKRPVPRTKPAPYTFSAPQQVPHQMAPSLEQAPVQIIRVLEVLLICSFNFSCSIVPTWPRPHLVWWHPANL